MAGQVVVVMYFRPARAPPLPVAAVLFEFFYFKFYDEFANDLTYFSGVWNT
jgi:hypothetical protein